MRLSVILITKNEAENIVACLESVAWADERVVVDSGSTDDTVQLARAAGARVIETDWAGYGPQKNRALDAAQGDWVFSIDADERATPELRAEIERAMSAPGQHVAFAVPRRSSYCGRFMRHGGWWPDHVVRLFRRGAGRFSDDQLHERVVVDGPCGKLGEPLIHYTYRDLEEVIAKVNRYSTLSATMMFEAGRRAGMPSAIARGFWTFLRGYVFRLGFLDGAEGFMLAVSNAEHTYYRYAKLRQIGRDAKRGGA